MCKPKEEEAPEELEPSSDTEFDDYDYRGVDPESDLDIE